MPAKYADPNNIFLRARLRAAERDPRFLERIWTSMQLNISKDSLECYESGYRMPPDTTVLIMAKVYDDLPLVLEALSLTAYGPFLKEHFGIEVSRTSIADATLDWLSERNDLSDDLSMKLISAVSDRRIDVHELPIVEKVVKESREFISAALRMICVIKCSSNRELHNVS